MDGMEHGAQILTDENFPGSIMKLVSKMTDGHENNDTAHSLSEIVVVVIVAAITRASATYEFSISIRFIYGWISCGAHLIIVVFDYGKSPTYTRNLGWQS